MAAYRTSNLSDYLIDAADLSKGETLYIKPDRNITVAEMQGALNAQYGQGKYKAHSHGSARYVSERDRFYGMWKGETEVNPCEEYLDGSYVHPKPSTASNSK